MAQSLPNCSGKQREHQRGKRPGYTLFRFACIVLLLLTSSSLSLAQGTVDQAKQRLREAISRIAVPKDLLVDGPPVRKAFREVVEKPRTWTVRVLCDDKPAALGCVMGPNGWIVTKASLLEGTVHCKFHDGQTLPAEIVGVHKKHDLAMLKVEAQNLPVASLQQESYPLIGSWVATPGLDQDPIAIGVVSVAQRTIPKQSGVLGVQLEMSEKGPLINRIVPDSPAEKAGLQVNDVVLKVNGKRTKDMQSLVLLVRSFSPGEDINVEIERDGKKITVLATLSQTIQGQKKNRKELQNSMGSHLSNYRYGFPAVLQHDTVIKPADCGGPLVDLDGQVVGINIARAGRTESFAIPVAILRQVSADLMSGKLAPKEETATSGQSKEKQKSTGRQSRGAGLDPGPPEPNLGPGPPEPQPLP